MQESRTNYFENLDGLRFFCFLFVFLHHSFHTESSSILNTDLYIFVKKTLFVNGNLGVNFFFVLSGFLITYLLIKEKQVHSKINIQNFWVRRILRIWPLYYFCLFFGFIVFPFIKKLMGVPSNETATIFSYLTFTNNFEFIEKGLPDASMLGVLWSIAIEEQFYFVWPIILSLVSIKRYWLVFISVIFISLVFRFSNLNYMIHEHHTLSCIGDMAVGGFGAWLILTYGDTHIRNIPQWLIICLYFLVCLVLVFRKDIYVFNTFFAVCERILLAVLFLCVILEQNYAKNSFFKCKNFKLISYLGTISYGLYCLHFIGILTVITLTKKFGLNQSLWQVIFLETISALFVTILISHFSYKYFESYFLRLKAKFT